MRQWFFSFVYYTTSVSIMPKVHYFGKNFPKYTSFYLALGSRVWPPRLPFFSFFFSFIYLLFNIN